MNTTPNNNVELGAAVLHEEQRCQVYLTARKAVLTQARRAASLLQLVRQQPTRLDYRIAWRQAAADYTTAANRAEQAYQSWQTAARRTDSTWTAAGGRTLRPVTGEAA